MSELNYKGAVSQEIGRTMMYTTHFDGGEYPLIGESANIKRIRKQIHFASTIDLPFFILGEDGTEKRSVAYCIHRAKALAEERFISIPAGIHDAGNYLDYLEKGLELASQGTLFLSDIDTLSDQIKDTLMKCFSLESFDSELKRRHIQLVISCKGHANISIFELVRKLFGRPVPSLEIQVSPLRERREDIRAHIDYILQHQVPLTGVSLTKDAYQVLIDYDWPLNIEQLQRILMFLVSCISGEISRQDIISSGLIQVEPKKRDLIDSLLTQDLTAFEQSHPALLKALSYMSEHFREEITLSLLAKVSYVSASHLSYLFRKNFLMSFKNVLVQLRVKYAKQLIEASPMIKITDVCLQAGFGDLSHFEKMFRRFERMTPRQFRQKQRELRENAHQA